MTSQKCILEVNEKRSSNDDVINHIYMKPYNEPRAAFNSFSSIAYKVIIHLICLPRL